jgi:hypothetical protein
MVVVDVVAGVPVLEAELVLGAFFLPFLALTMAFKNMHRRIHWRRRMQKQTYSSSTVSDSELKSVCIWITALQ